MQFSTTLIAAVAAILPLVSAHCRLIEPLPYNGGTDNSPLDAGGANFPCKFAGAMTPPSNITTFVAGQPGQFVIQGSAVHGGGSCQISITYDDPPTKNSVFKVIKSFEGACPISAVGNLPADPNNDLPPLDFTIPADIKGGKAVFVWTWFNRIGNREMYMNCAPINIQGGSTSDGAYQALPDMFVANIAVPQKQCTTTEGEDIIFPNPGKDVTQASSGTNLAPACGSGSGTGSGSGSGSGASSAAPAVTTQPALVGGAATATDSVGTSFTPITEPSSAHGAAPTAMTSVTSMMTVTTMMTVSSGAPVATSAAAGPVATTSAPSPSAGSGSTATGGNMIMGPCDSTKATIICHSNPSVYSECYNNNMEYGPFAVPPGTKCVSANGGSFQAIAGGSKGRRALRQVHEHLKRNAFRFHGH